LLPETIALLRQPIRGINTRIGKSRMKTPGAHSRDGWGSNSLLSPTR